MYKQHPAKNVVFVEGLPAIGKTTYAKRLEKEQAANHDCMRIREHSVLSLDMSRQALLGMDDYYSVLDSCEDYFNKEDAKTIIERVRRQTRFFDGFAILSYIPLLAIPNRLFQLRLLQMRDKEIVDGRVVFPQYENTVCKLWNDFSVKASNFAKTYIFEGSLLQNHLYELIGYYFLSDEAVLHFCKNLLSTLNDVTLNVVYLDTHNYRSVIEKAQISRGSLQDYDNGETPIVPLTWFEGFQAWVEASPYGRMHHLRGIDGVCAFCSECNRISKFVLDGLGMKVDHVFRD